MIRSIVARYPVETPMASDDVEFLVDVLQRHYDWDAKRGVGIRAIVTRNIRAWNGSSIGLILQRQDGSEIDISWRVALMPGGAPTDYQNAVTAGRYEVVAQRNAASAAVPRGAACPICFQPLLDDRHVDHRPPKTFKNLFAFWLQIEEGLEYEQVATEDVGAADRRFVDRSLASRWAAYHAQHADLRVIHKHENLGRAA